MFGVSNENLGCPLSHFSKTYFPEQQIQPLGGGKHRYKTRKTGKMALRKIVGKKPPRFWICCSLGYFALLTKKFWRGQWGHTPFWPPAARPPKRGFCPFWGRKIPKSKIFFLQISHILGPIDGINNIFSPGVPFWLYSES